MMQSVALTESCYAHDDDYVVVEVPVRSTNVRFASTVFNVLAKACIHHEGKGDDDEEDEGGDEIDNEDSYDYCDDMAAVTKVVATEQNTTTSNHSIVPLDINLSLVIDEDDVSFSEYSPSISENKETADFASEQNDNISELSTSIVNECVTSDESTGDSNQGITNGTVDNDEVNELVAVIPAATTVKIVETMSPTTVTATAVENEEIATTLPSDANILPEEIQNKVDSVTSQEEEPLLSNNVNNVNTVENAEAETDNGKKADRAVAGWFAFEQPSFISNTDKMNDVKIVELKIEKEKKGEGGVAGWFDFEKPSVSVNADKMNDVEIAVAEIEKEKKDDGAVAGWIESNRRLSNKKRRKQMKLAKRAAATAAAIDKLSVQQKNSSSPVINLMSASNRRCFGGKQIAPMESIRGKAIGI